MVGIKEKGLNQYGDGLAWVRGSMIGQGGFGSVYLATPKISRSRYSYYPSTMAVKSAEFSASASIQKERMVLSDLQGCPDHIITCFGEETTIGDNGLMAFNLLLEYASGGTLSDRIKKSGGSGFPEFEAKEYTRSILRGLDHIHTTGYVHCDLKPDNILLVRAPNDSNEFRAKIGDFGLAKRAEVQSKKRRLEPYWRGTPMYLSPEAVIDKVQEAPCDIWALGCIVLEMLTGKRPWSGKNTEEVLEKIGAEDELPNIPSEISEEAKDFLKCCFVRNARYRLTAELMLTHPFVEGLEDDDSIEEEGEDLSDNESIFSVSAESDDEFSSGSYCSSCEENDDNSVSSYADEGEVKVEESERVKRRKISFIIRPQYHPVSCIIPAGV
ncbi:hypothetical protein RD792_008472 [Penstemon davidsonii]|uniref:Protein kinase domain-containing protein n=1 Tax=Penstemon davidsonii TaxID=160366 RepID=A0ABR0D9C6_9LAMI|nr:hypothetical protein RD792_008472 [Penstemon davidsonii]